MHNQTKFCSGLYSKQDSLNSTGFRTQKSIDLKGKEFAKPKPVNIMNRMQMGMKKRI